MTLDPLMSCTYDITYQISSSTKRMLLFALLLFGSTSGSPQVLTLFEETETNLRTAEEERSRTVRRDREGNVINGPEFTLVGTTRIGGSSLVVVEDRLGEIISISMTEGANTSIPSHPGFQIVDVGAGNVAIKFPDNFRCIEFMDRGVGCEADDMARLVLTNAKPLESANRGTILGSGSNTESLLQEEADQDNATNPFEALLQRAANPDSEVDGTAFEPRRINPEDVPPGMRIVSTPFGDRLVEDE